MHYCMCVYLFYVCMWMSECVGEECVCVCPPYTKPSLDLPQAKMTKWESPRPVFRFHLAPYLFIASSSSLSALKQATWKYICDLPDEIDDVSIRFQHFLNSEQQEFKTAGRLNLLLQNRGSEHKTFTLSMKTQWIFMSDALHEETPTFNFWYIIISSYISTHAEHITSVCFWWIQNQPACLVSYSHQSLNVPAASYSTILHTTTPGFYQPPFH